MHVESYVISDVFVSQQNCVGGIGDKTITLKNNESQY